MLLPTILFFGGIKMEDSDKYRYTVGDVDELIDEKGNQVILLRKLAWGDHKEKLEIRKWIIGIDTERANGGFPFLTEEGPHNLTKALVKLGYGNTEEVLNELKLREDFNEALVNTIGEAAIKKVKKALPNEKITYYDPKKALAV